MKNSLYKYTIKKNKGWKYVNSTVKQTKGDYCPKANTVSQNVQPNEENEIFPVLQNQEAQLTAEEVFELINDAADFCGETFDAFDGKLKTIFDFFRNPKSNENYLDNSSDKTIEKSDNAAEFDKSDIKKITNVVDSIPWPISNFVDISEDDINAAVSEMEEKGVENFIKENASCCNDMLSEGFLDEAIKDLKNGNIDELYDKIMKVADKQVDIGPFSVSSVISEDLETSAKEALEMLSEKSN